MTRMFYSTAVSVMFAVASLGNQGEVLWQAARDGDIESVHVALGKKAEVNFVGQDGSTPLWQAANAGYEDIVWALLRHEADPLMRPQKIAKESSHGARKLSPRHWLVKKSSSDGRLALPKRKVQFAKGSAILNRAVSDENELRSGMRKGEASSENKEEPGPFEFGLPLHVAVRQGHVRVVELLIEHGHPRQIEVQDSLGNTPLHLACASDDMAIFEAVTSPKKITVQYLEHLRVARMRTNERGFLPVHLIILHGGESAFSKGYKLLQSGSDLHAHCRNQVSQNAFTIAQAKRRRAIIDQDDDTIRSCSQFMLMLANQAPQTAIEAEHLAPRVIAKMNLTLRNAIVKATLAPPNDLGDLDAALDALLIFPSDCAKIDFGDELDSEVTTNDENSEPNSSEDSRRTKRKGKAKKKRSRAPSFYGYGSDLDIVGEDEIRRNN